jgi:hypothetical protein
MNPRNMIRLTILSGFQSALNKMSEPSPQEFESAVADIKRNLLYQVRAALSQAPQEIKKTLPRKPGGGRKRSLNPRRKREARNKVSALLRKGVAYKVALVRVGQKLGVSARTIQRAWQTRAEDA